MKKLIITLLFVIPFVLLSYCQGDEEAQSRESMAVDATETQWSFQLASTESYKNDRIETSVIGKNSMSAAPTTEGSWLKDPITGGAVGLAKGAQEKKQMKAQQEAHARQQAEREKIQREQQQVEMERLEKLETAEEKFDAGTVLEIQKSLIRMDFDPGDINGKMQPATENAIRLYEQKYNLLETGRPSQELLKHMLRNGG